MCKIKYFLFFKKYIHILFWGSVGFWCYFLKSNFKLMNSNKLKNNLTTETKEQSKKSKLDLLTNENDFLVKNLKKAG